MIIFSYSETHSHLATYFKDEIAHSLSVFYENKSVLSRIGLESAKQKL